MNKTRWTAGLFAILALCLTNSTAWGQRGSFLRTSPEVLTAFKPAVATPSESVASVLKGDKQVALGTIVGDDGWILTKATEIDGSPKVKLKDGRVLDAKVMGIDDKFDLAMLKIDADKLKPIQWASTKETEVGDFIATVGFKDEPVTVGVISVLTRKLPEILLPGGYMGVLLSEERNGLQISEVTKDSGAEKAGMKPGDVVVKVDGREVKAREDLLRILSRRKAGQTVRLDLERDGEAMELNVTLGKRPESFLNRGDLQNSMGSELSTRRTGFPEVLQHDSVIKPNECGGPLVDLDGKALGVNIARAGRVKSYTIPSEVLKTLIVDFKAGKLAPK